jgi:hypothetical protein
LVASVASFCFSGFASAAEKQTADDPNPKTPTAYLYIVSIPESGATAFEQRFSYIDTNKIPTLAYFKGDGALTKESAYKYAESFDDGLLYTVNSTTMRSVYAFGAPLDTLGANQIARGSVTFFSKTAITPTIVQAFYARTSVGINGKEIRLVATDGSFTMTALVGDSATFELPLAAKLTSTNERGETTTVWHMRVINDAAKTAELTSWLSAESTPM